MSNLHAAFRSDFLQTTDEDHYMKEIHKALIYVFHMTGDTDMHLLVTDTFKKK
jgi:hypothetical protein